VIGVGLVGLGEIGQVHLSALRSSDHIQVSALCDLDEERLNGSRRGEWLTTHFDQILERPDVEALDICLPHSMHAPLAIRALESGRHVLLEKPMAMTVAECDQVIAAAAAADRVVGVSHNQLFYEPHQMLSKMISDGSIGDLRTIRARLAIGGRYGSWRSDPSQAGGGLLIDAGVHRIYMLQELGGPVVAVSANMDMPGMEESYSIILEFSCGAIGTIDATYHGPAGLFDDQIEVVGTKAILEVAGCEAQFEGFDDGPSLRQWSNGAWETLETSDSWDRSVVKSVQAFFEAVSRGVTPRVDGVTGRSTVAVIEAAYKSAREGIRVELPFA